MGREKKECQKPHLVWVAANQEGVPASKPYMGICARAKGGVSETAPCVGRARQEFQEPCPTWVGQDIELWQAGRKWAYGGREREIIRNHAPCGRGKTISPRK